MRTNALSLQGFKELLKHLQAIPSTELCDPPRQRHASRELDIAAGEVVVDHEFCKGAIEI